MAADARTPPTTTIQWAAEMVPFYRPKIAMATLQHGVTHGKFRIIQADGTLAPPAQNPSDMPKLPPPGSIVAWCSDWDKYTNSPETPLLCIEAHRDVALRSMPCVPVRISDDIVMATGHDNRVSCMVLHELVVSCIQPALAANRVQNGLVVMCLWTTGEETGMCEFRAYLDRAPAHVQHTKEYWIVLDVTDPSPETPTDAHETVNQCLGRGALWFRDDPIEALVVDYAIFQYTEPVLQQRCTVRARYPGDLELTHAGVLYRYHKRTCPETNLIVSRAGIPVFGVQSGRSAMRNGTHSGLHGPHTLASLTDIESMYRKLCTACESVFAGWWPVVPDPSS